MALPVINGDNQRRSRRKFASYLLQFWRFALLGLIVLLLNLQYEKRQQQSALKIDSGAGQQLLHIQKLVPAATELRLSKLYGVGCFQILDAAGQTLGYAGFTLPKTSHVLGFSGPTNVLVVLDSQGTVVESEILQSADTRDHVESIRNDSQFLSQLRGMSLSQLASGSVDGVSGATLTSMAIVEALRLRFRPVDDGPPQFAFSSLRFSEQIAAEDVERFFPSASTVRANPSTGLYEALNQNDDMVGSLLRLSPAADNIVGYQGPTDAVVVLSDQLQVLGLAVGKSYDNEPYTDYVAGDGYFGNLFDGRNLAELAELDALNIEGVSGATMTSQSVASGIAQAAQQHIAFKKKLADYQPASQPQLTKSGLPVRLRDISTVGITLFACLIGMTRLKRKRVLRIAFQLVLIGWLGLLNGDMVSQALWLGWAQHGIAWQKSLGLLALSAAAVCLPIFSGQNVYCAHICPHGAVQQLTRNRLPWRIKLNARAARVLKLLPAALLLTIIAIGMLNFAISAVDLEPFDAWIWTVAGTASIVIAVVGLAFSLLVPMGYCRFACPTGAILNGLRRTGSTWSLRDTAATLLATASVAAYLLY